MQSDLWIPTTEVVATPAHPFYGKLNAILVRHSFDEFVEEKFRAFYSERKGRPGLPPGNYIRLLLIGFFEGLKSEREIAWRTADSLSLRGFLGIPLTERTPDHSTISKTRRLIDIETHDAIFSWVLQILAKEGIITGKTVGIDSTLLEANAAMRNIVRRDSGKTYQEFLEDLAADSGIKTPSREDLVRLDRKRKKKTSNLDWKSPVDPDSRVARMKDGTTHLAHKVEHAVDMASGAVVGLTVQPADTGDTTTIEETVRETFMNLLAATSPQGNPSLRNTMFQEVLGDKGYHSGPALVALHEFGLRTYISEPKRKRRCWEDRIDEQISTYENRRRVQGNRGRRLMRSRGELVERSFAHCYETGGMRRLFLREQENVKKRLLVQVAGFNLSLIMRRMFGTGTPRGFADLVLTLFALLQFAFSASLQAVFPSTLCLSPNFRKLPVP
ncbi:MAG: transposase [Candidatus Ozemobacteraceae bacterium]